MNKQYDIYQKIMLLMMRSKQQMAEVMERRKMTPIQGMLLMLFQPGQGRTMQQLTQLMACDASNTTGLIDRLDAHGLIERGVDPKDRRVKVITLTQKGETCRNEVLDAVREAEAVDIARLTEEEQQQLVHLITKLLD